MFATTKSVSPTADVESAGERPQLEMVVVPQDILEIASRQFGQVFGSAENLGDHSFEWVRQEKSLPSNLGKNRAHVKDLSRLCYLTTIREGERKIPFKIADREIFRMSEEKRKHTVWWFKVGLIPFFLFSAVAYISLIGASHLTDAAKGGIAGTAGLISAFVLQLLGLYITGINPDSAKDADNLKQNTVQKVKGAYDEMAKELVTLQGRDPRFARALAEQINLDCICLAAKNCYLDPLEVKSIFKMLIDAVLFVRGERNFLRHHELALYNIRERNCV